MRRSALLLLLLGCVSLAACDTVELPSSPGDAPPAAPGDVQGQVIWDPLSGTPAQAGRMADEACARYGLNAETTRQMTKGDTATLSYSCQ